MKILSRYILREVFTYFAITLFIFTGILFTLRVLKLTSLIINKGVSLSQVGTVFLAVIPAFLEIAIPLAALLGPMLTFARLSGDSEVIVIRASGISLARLVQPILLFAVFTALLCLGVSHYLKPWGFRTLSTTLFEIARTKSTAGLEPGIFNELGQIVLYAEEIDQSTGKLKNVLVDDRRRDEQSRIIVAAEGEIRTNTAERSIVFHLTDGQIHEENDGKYIVTHYVTNDITLDADKLHGEEEATAERRARELSWNELQEQQATLLHSLKRESEIPTPIPSAPLASSTPKQPLTSVPLLDESEQPKTIAELRAEAKEKLLKIQFEIHNRFSLPIAALLLALIGMPLGVQSPRSQKTWGPGLSAVIGLGAFLTYFAVFTIAKTFAEDGKLPALIAAWIPNLFTFVVALYFLRQMSSERWQTVSEGFEKIFHRVKNLFAISPRHEQSAL